MKRYAIPFLILAILPATSAAQLEVGLESGFAINTGFEFADNVTTISIPRSQARLGVEAGDNLMIEMLLGVSRTSQGDNSLSTLNLVPGVNFGVGESGAYVRGEIAIMRAGFDSGSSSDSETQFGIGGAVGLKKPIGDGPVSYRLEAGFDRFIEDEDSGLEAYNAIRAIFGLSVVVG